MANFLLYTVTILIWGTTWIGITFQLGSVPIEWSVAYRFGLSALLLLGFCLISRRPLRFTAKDHLIFAGLGVFLFSTNYFLTYWSTEYLTSGLVAVGFSTLILMNIFNGVLFLHNKIEGKVLAGALLGISGLSLVFWPEIEAFDLSDQTFLGLGICLLAVLSASFGNTVASTKGGKALPVFQKNAWGMLYGTGFMLLYALARGNEPVFEMTFDYIASLVYLAVFGTIIAFTLFLKLIGNVGMERASYITIIFPIVALVISTLFEDYTWSLPAIAGLALVGVGNMFMLNKKPKDSLAAEGMQRPVESGS